MFSFYAFLVFSERGGNESIGQNGLNNYIVYNIYHLVLFHPTSFDFRNMKCITKSNNYFSYIFLLILIYAFKFFLIYLLIWKNHTAFDCRHNILNFDQISCGRSETPINYNKKILKGEKLS